MSHSPSHVEILDMQYNTLKSRVEVGDYSPTTPTDPGSTEIDRIKLIWEIIVFDLIPLSGYNFLVEEIVI